MQKKYRIKKMDEVIITSGNHKGTVGKVMKFDTTNDRVYVSNIPPLICHQKPSQMREGGKIEKPRSLHISNVSVFYRDKDNNIPTKVRIERKDGKRMRIMKKNKQVIGGDNEK